MPGVVRRGCARRLRLRGSSGLFELVSLVAAVVPAELFHAALVAAVVLAEFLAVSRFPVEVLKLVLVGVDELDRVVANATGRRTSDSSQRPSGHVPVGPAGGQLGKRSGDDAGRPRVPPRDRHVAVVDAAVFLTLVALLHASDDVLAWQRRREPVERVAVVTVRVAPVALPPLCSLAVRAVPDDVPPGMLTAARGRRPRGHELSGGWLDQDRERVLPTLAFGSADVAAASPSLGLP